MNKVILLFSIATIVLFLISLLTSEQAWLGLIPKYNKTANNSRSVFDIEKSLSRYWRTKKVKNEFYLKDTVKRIVFGWKLFEEWNWYCMNCVSPLIDEFQKINGHEENVKTVNKIIKNTKRHLGARRSGLKLCTTAGGYQGLARLKHVTFERKDSNPYLIDSPSGAIWKIKDNTCIWKILVNNESIPNSGGINRNVVNEQSSTTNLSATNENRIKIGFVKDPGNNNILKNYPFFDNNLPDRSNFPIKFNIMHNNGYSMYSSVVTVSIQPLDYALVLNFLNIFNAAAKIKNELSIKINKLLKVRYHGL